MTKLDMLIETNRRKYLTPGTISLLRPKNAVFLSTANSIRHELSKTIGAIMLSRYGDIEFSLRLKKLIWEIEQEINKSMGQFSKANEQFITEAAIGKRQIDLIRLRDEQKFEFETDHTIKKEGAFTFYI